MDEKRRDRASWTSPKTSSSGCWLVALLVLIRAVVVRGETVAFSGRQAAVVAGAAWMEWSRAGVHCTCRAAAVQLALGCSVQPSVVRTASIRPATPLSATLHQPASQPATFALHQPPHTACV